MSPLQILKETIQENVLMITIIGQLDESNVDANAPQIYEAIDSLDEGGTLILNFSGLEYMNSKSIGYTTDFYNKMLEKSGKLIIAESPPQIVDILNVVGLTQVIPFAESVSEAKEMLSENIAPQIKSELQKEEVSVSPSEQIEETKISEDQKPSDDLSQLREELPTESSEDSGSANITEERSVESEVNLEQEQEESSDNGSSLELADSPSLEDKLEEMDQVASKIDTAESVEKASERKEELVREEKQEEEQEENKEIESSSISINNEEQSENKENLEDSPQESSQDEEGFPWLIAVIGVAVLILLIGLLS